MSEPALPDLDAWFAARGWTPMPFQRQVWSAMARGESGLLHATTGAGKTYAVWLGTLQRLAQVRGRGGAPPLSVLWLTPMRALAADTTRALTDAAQALAPHWTLGLRTGDTSSAERAAQSRRLPTALVTTPESLSLLLTRADARDALGSVRVVVVDEWHELVGNKRGVQVQLALARLRTWSPELVVWGLSATLGNLAQAMDALSDARAPSTGTLVQGHLPKRMEIDTLLPDGVGRFPWAGHLGMAMLPHVVQELESARTALVFLNTRSQAELWYQAVINARPEWAGLIALHHGSLDRATRDWVETGLKQGLLKAVFCTSSLDLGVDFLPVERVLQIGSPKGVARLMQRAGRSGHAPGRHSRVTVVPTHSLELVEGAAARAAAMSGRVEARTSPHKPLDVLVQHLVTVALGGGFAPDALLQEVRRAWAYRDLRDDEWQWTLDFVRQGGHSLTAYPDYHRVTPDGHGVWRVPDARLARRHRMSIGTIVSDATMNVRWWRAAGGSALGSIEEGFIARLRPGDNFLFAGRLLELVRVQDMTAYVRRASGKRAAVPRWNGGRMPLSTELAHAVVAQLDAAAHGRFESPEMEAARPLLELQARWSALPSTATLVAETLHSREGWHLFLYPFAGRHAHLGLASLLAWRAANRAPSTFSVAFNDYGLELLSATRIDWPALLANGDLFATHTLMQDVFASLNAGELVQRRFREIARVSGLVFQGYPGAHKSTRQLQASSGLFYEVFRRHDPGNLLLTQAETEVLRQELDLDRIEATLVRMHGLRLQVCELKHPSPFAFPLMVERFREQLSTEKLADRLARMLADAEHAAGPEPTDPDAAERPVIDTDVQAALRMTASADDAGKRSRRHTRRPRKASKPLPLL